MSRRSEIADAAIKTLANEGMRGFTHRAVDRTAGLPEGSTSYYHRTRTALLNALVERLVELDERDLPESATDIGGTVANLVEPLLDWAIGGRERQIARYEVVLESTRRPELRRKLRQSSSQVRRMLGARLQGVSAADMDEIANRLVAPLDGLLMYAATSAVPPDRAELGSRVHELVEWAFERQRSTSSKRDSIEAREPDSRRRVADTEITLKMLSMSNIPPLLHRIVHRMDRDADRVLRRELGISNRKAIALLVLDAEGSMSQRALATELGYTEPAVSALVRELVERNAVAVTAVDGRERNLSVTAEGARIVEAAHALVDPRFASLVTAAGVDAPVLEEQLRRLDAGLGGGR